MMQVRTSAEVRPSPAQNLPENEDLIERGDSNERVQRETSRAGGETGSRQTNITIQKEFVPSTYMNHTGSPNISQKANGDRLLEHEKFKTQACDTYKLAAVFSLLADSRLNRSSRADR